MKSSLTLLVVGAGFGQIPAIKKAKAMGINVVCTDKNPNAEGMQWADYSYVVDVIDKQGNLEIAKKHNVNGVMTMQSDLPVPTIGYINDKLGLNGVSLEVAERCSNKIETRKLLKEKQCSQPKFELVSSFEEVAKVCDTIGYPVVIKAPDSSGSRGVTKVIEPNGILAAYQEALKYSRKKEIIVEEFISGLEFGAQTFSVNGKCEVVLLHSDIISSPPYMVPVAHSFPFVEISDTRKKEAINDIKKVVEALGIKNGPANVDFIWDDKNQKIKILEVGARVGATCLPELVYYHTGIDWVEQTILNAINQKVNLSIKKQDVVTAYVFSAPKDGILQKYTFPNDLLNNSNLLEYEITAKIGEEVNLLRKGTDRIGKVIYKGETVKETVDACLNFINKTKIEISG